METQANIEIPHRLERDFLPEDLQVDSWDTLKPYFDELVMRPLLSKQELIDFLKEVSELYAIIEEDAGWRYIKMTCNTADEDLKNNYLSFVKNIQPHLEAYGHRINRRIEASPYRDEFTTSGYYVYFRAIKKEIEIYREENIPLKTKANEQEQKYSEITGAMTVEVDGKELTIQQAAKYLENTDRKVREEVWRGIQDRRLLDHEKLDALFDELKKLRTEIAVNSGFKNYRDYMFAALGRFDYTPADCEQFQNSLQQAMIPLLNDFAQERKKNLGVDKLRPWDKGVDALNRPPLKVFENTDELIEKGIEVFKRVDPFFGEVLLKMHQNGYLDLASRKNKAPGGYNYPLYESGIPFIFMNAAGTLRDMVTLMHEGGHAVHSVLNAELELTAFKDLPSEVAELASMSMELLSMDHWDVFFSDEEDLKRAKKEHLEDILGVLPWIALIDKFQHWIYTHPNHTDEDRRLAWLEMHKAFSDRVTDYEGLEKERSYLWQKQMHIFQVPFYYVEYGFAQLGAIAMWRNYRQDSQKAIKKYKEALSLGYTKTIPEVYEAAGISFQFSTEYVRELIDFVRGELDKV